MLPIFVESRGSRNGSTRAAKSETLSLLYADTSSTRSWLNACRTPNSNRIDLPKSTSRPNVSFVLVNEKSLLMPDPNVLKSGVCTWCEYDSRKPVASVTGNDTRKRGEIVWCPIEGTKMFVSASICAYTASSVAAAGFQPGWVKMRPGVRGNSVWLL